MLPLFPRVGRQAGAEQVTKHTVHDNDCNENEAVRMCARDYDDDDEKDSRAFAEFCLHTRGVRARARLPACLSIDLAQLFGRVGRTHAALVTRMAMHG